MGNLSFDQLWAAKRPLLPHLTPTTRTNAGGVFEPPGNYHLLENSQKERTKKNKQSPCYPCREEYIYIYIYISIYIYIYIYVGIKNFLFKPCLVLHLRVPYRFPCFHLPEFYPTYQITLSVLRVPYRSSAFWCNNYPSTKIRKQ